MKLSNLIIAYRKEHNLSQRQFAERCGVTNGYISMIENNRNPSTKKPVIPSLDKLKAIANAMNISLNELIETIDDCFVDMVAPNNVVDLDSVLNEWKSIELSLNGLKLTETEKQTVLDALNLSISIIRRNR